MKNYYMVDDFESRIDSESFGSMCPENWEEIASYLNEKIETGDGNADEVWEKYCSGLYPDCPKPFYDPDGMWAEKGVADV